MLPKIEPLQLTMSIIAMLDLDPRNEDEAHVQLEGETVTMGLWEDNEVTRLGTSLSKNEVDAISRSLK